MNCTIVALDGCPLSSVAGPLEILSLANSMVASSQAMDVAIVGESASEVNCANGLCLRPHLGISNVKKSDLIIMGAIGKPTYKSLHINPKVLDWLRDQYEKGAQIVSICTGAFVLAASGILDGKKATTHWACERVFRQLFPKVELHSDALITQDGSIYCSGGASAYQDMALFLVQQHFGSEIAQQCAKGILVDLDRQSQRRYASFKPYRQHSDKRIHDLQDWLEKNVTSDFHIPFLANKVHLSERQFKRRFKQATGEAPLVYIQTLRMELAKQHLESSSENVASIGRKTGYEDTRFFRQLFKRHTGLAPVEYRHKFNLDLRSH